MSKHALGVAVAAVMVTAGVTHTLQARTQEIRPTIVTHEQLAAKGLLAESDEDFIKHAARAAAIKIQTGKLAITKASNADVKAFADKLVNDNTATAKAVAEWAAKKNVALKDDDPAVKMKLDKHKWLEEKTGTDFDRQFVQAMIGDYSDVIMLFSLESRNTGDAALKKFADETLPLLREQTSTARRLIAKLPG
jgi:putative membrane protein